MSSYAGREPSSYVFELLDSEGTPRYVGWGAMDGKTGAPPWLKLWRLRRGDGTPIGDWLALLAEPPSVRLVFATAIPGRLARWLATLRRQQLPGLLTRTGRSIVWGGRRFASVRAASRELGIPRTTLRRLLAQSAENNRESTAR
ncbi:MAG TPA: hypothetical protein PJ982_02605 [Lacipirellulaceae bacterium]|nr:hypothetical protein [Lacipirellulaceae bacterium]